ncbi:sensor histidine kinase [Actinoplanes italicus]|nr:histidine kinase [Actinoplanes italicus]
MHPVRGVRGPLVVLVATGYAVWLELPAVGTPYLLTSVVFATVGVGLVVTGVLLGTEPGQRPNARLFVAAGLLWLSNDLGARMTGPFPALTVLVRPLDELLLMVILLRYPGVRITDRISRIAVITGCVALLVPHYAGNLVWNPDEAGFPDTFWWPTIVTAMSAARAITTVYAIVAILLPAVLVGLIIRRYTTSRGLARRELRPVLAAAVAVALAYVVTQSVLLAESSNDLDAALATPQNLLLLAVPIAFGAAAVRRWLDRSAVADLVMSIPQPADLDTVRDALRQVLLDPSLAVYVWLPERRLYTDGDATYEQPPEAGRIRRDLADARGEPLATVLLEPALDRRTDLVDAALRAAALSLENARLHADLLDRLQELERSRTRIVEAGITERRRVERDLHDGAQQRLLALAATIGRAHAAADPATRAVLGQARTELRAALKELRDLARGIHPAVLEQVGLGAAVEAVTESLPLAVDVEIDTAGRLPPMVETAVYFVVCEALANVVKHARARRAGVALRRTTSGVDLVVSDDGAGGARVTPGGGLAGLADRVAALNGRLHVDSSPGCGTRLTLELPCES